MIINVRGTSGTGKSTLIRRVMDCYPTKTRVMAEARKQPIGYICSGPGLKSLGVIGHYETPCGGCDTIAEMDRIFDLVRKTDDAGMNVLFEGLLISADVNRTAALHEEGRHMLVVALSTPIDVCIESVNARRRARNPDLGPVKEKNTISKFRGVQKSMDRLHQQSVPASWGTRDGALEQICLELGIPADAS